MADETKKPEEQTTSSALSEATKTPLHDAIFGNDPDGQDNDTPRGAIGQNVTQVGVGESHLSVLRSGWGGLRDRDRAATGPAPCWSGS